jgi:NTP pyrophosphatase (non-canonical NTP hydrolase)
MMGVKQDASSYLGLLQIQIAAYLQSMPTPTTSAEEQILNLVEEVGELSRALLKRKQGIRGTREQWDSEVKKEIGDVFCSLIAVANFEDLDFFDTVNERAQVVLKRRWDLDATGHGLPEE